MRPRDIDRLDCFYYARGQAQRLRRGIRPARVETDEHRHPEASVEAAKSSRLQIDRRTHPSAKSSLAESADGLGLPTPGIRRHVELSSSGQPKPACQGLGLR